MSLASRFRWLGKYFPVPEYGTCGGSEKNCAIKREDLDPLDQCFYDHDQRCYAAHQLDDPYLEEDAKKEADKLLQKAISELTEEDMNKIPVWVWEKPFLRRFYAKEYRKACLKIFN